MLKYLGGIGFIINTLKYWGGLLFNVKGVSLFRLGPGTNK